MQTFLPHPSFEDTARVLDRQRLGKQRVETFQVARMLLGETDGGSWRKHPAVLMWSGHEASLIEYGLTMCHEWISRGYTDNMAPRLADLLLHHGLVYDAAPAWLGVEEFHRSHQSNLLRKNPDHYRRYFLNVPDNLPYFWPVSDLSDLVRR